MRNLRRKEDDLPQGTETLSHRDCILNMICFISFMDDVQGVTCENR